MTILRLILMFNWLWLRFLIYRILGVISWSSRVEIYVLLVRTYSCEFPSHYTWATDRIFINLRRWVDALHTIKSLIRGWLNLWVILFSYYKEWYLFFLIIRWIKISILKVIIHILLVILLLKFFLQVSISIRDKLPLSI